MRFPSPRPPEPFLARLRRSNRHQRFGPAKTLLGTAAVASLLLPTELVLRRVQRRPRPHLPWLFHQGLTRSLGIRVTAHGRPAQGGGVLFVANHLSWADIPVLGSRLRAAFVAKSEVEGWGAVGWLASVARTVYIQRSRRSTTSEQLGQIAQRLRAGENVILFPEGTNNDGVSILPFKSSLFAAVEDGEFPIQPVTIAYTRLNGLPITRERLPDIAWVGDAELWPHLFSFMALGRVRAELMFHEPVRAADFPDRKALTRHCQHVIEDGYRRLMRG